MNERAVAYLIHHGVVRFDKGFPEWMLPLDKLQNLLLLLGPDDVAPGYEHIQRLYEVQAEGLRIIEAQITRWNSVIEGTRNQRINGADCSKAD